MEGYKEFILYLDEEETFVLISKEIFGWPWLSLYTLGDHDPKTLGELDTQTLGELYGILKE